MVASVASGTPLPAVPCFGGHGSAQLTAGSTSTLYYYITNLQGDIIKIVDTNLNLKVRYNYDAWGKVLSVSGTLANTLGTYNPFRYRGYVYDDETGFYYLGSRYYDPTVGRFINADDVSTITNSKTITDKNLYAYCDNNPVMRVDDEGDFWFLAAVIGAAVGAVVEGAISAVTQLAETGSINWGVVGVNAAAGAITGALATTGIGLAASVAVNAGVGGATYVGTIKI